jgi:GNAT superfamily N-acetyltransferase
MSTRIVEVDPQNAVALSLLREAAVDIRSLYHPECAPGPPWPKNDPLGPRDVYVVLLSDEVAVACGSIRERGAVTAEIYRMYVHRNYRRKGIGRAVLCHLLSEARRLGYKRLLLETGNKQIAAMAFYESFGFRGIPRFGEHVHDPTSVCYELLLPGELQHNKGLTRRWS